jgi:hypothetical protein
MHNISFHADRAGLGIFWKTCTGLNIGNFCYDFLVTRPAGEANVRADVEGAITVWRW